MPSPAGAFQGNCVLIADEDTTTGADFSNRQPAWATVSNTSVAGLVIRDF